jgi:sulfur carrier protein
MQSGSQQRHRLSQPLDAAHAGLACTQCRPAFLSPGPPALILLGMIDIGNSSAPLRITLNGVAGEYASPLTVGGLLASLELDKRKVAIELNEAVVPRSLYFETPLATGDSLEIVHFIGGG